MLAAKGAVVIKPTPVKDPCDFGGCQPQKQALMIDGYEILDHPVLGKASLARDPKTGLTWQRCSVGQVWNGSTCAGEAKKFTFNEAQKLSVNGWRVPTVRELHSIVWCSNGKTRYIEVSNDGGNALEHTCTEGQQVPAIKRTVFPNTSLAFWTSSPYKILSAWGIHFFDGGIDSQIQLTLDQVRLVR
jgi:Protein of unknown function (DUF1566)